MTSHDGGQADGQADWARPELLRETDWLAEHIDDEDVVLLDCDVLPAYQRLHIPGALWSLSRYWKSDPSDDSQIYGLEDPERFAQLAGRLGLTPDTQVVAYDGSGGLYAARTWWTFDRFGHSNFAVLNGGLDKWYAEGRPLANDNPRAQRTEYPTPPAPHDETICRLDEIPALIEDEDHVFWDVRSDGEWTGANKRGTQRGGRIPGAVHLEWLHTLESPVRTLKPPAELRAMLADLGITPETRVTTY